MSGFQGRCAVITGAKGDIGAAIAAELARRGAHVFAVDIGYRERSGPETAGAGQIVRLPLDVTDAAAVSETFREISVQAAPISLLVNAAGGPGNVRVPVDQVTDADWHRVVSLNLDGLFFCCREAARAMKPIGGGAIVNISSGAGRNWTRTGVQAYAAAKSGVIGLTRQLARELGPAGIRVNCIAPGLIEVDATREEIARIPPEDRKAHIANIALGRLGKATDLVGPTLFFLGDDAAFVTGQTISVDGGSIMLG
ncbi:SDR family NAD(P)-dependent oxidoreductase [Mesorhizobium sp. L-8-10]|uniref:SDR family NAD(P)-dependent oxidoreductase n=1 Tax=Mesorhizobium sp. L-8-10 TaxID=2744523 RepID=UPI0019295E62|nr:SDR family NAD(P)-dependent oxidoreductase [Mesorhizobium sp. L-8-10]